MATLRSKEADRIDNDLEQLEAKTREIRKRKAELAAKQQEVVGRIMLNLVAAGEWTEEQLHDLLRPHIKRAKEFDLLGITPEGNEHIDEEPDVESESLTTKDDDLDTADIAEAEVQPGRAY